MSPFSLSNMDKEEAWSSGGILPPGRHLCRIDDIEEGKSSGGHPQMILDLEAIAGEDAGGTIRDWVVVIPKTYGKVKQILEAAGIEIEGGDWTFDPSVLKGREVSIVVRREPKPDGELVNKVVGYDLPRASDMGEEVPADREELGNGSDASRQDRDIPFRVRHRMPPEHRMRGSFDPSF